MPVFNLTSFTIAASAQNSNALGGHDFNWADSITIMGDPSGFTGTVNVEVADVDPASVADADYRVLQSGGSDVTITQDDATVIQNTGFRSIRLRSSMAEASERTCDVVAHEPASAFNRHS